MASFAFRIMVAFASRVFPRSLDPEVQPAVLAPANDDVVQLDDVAVTAAEEVQPSVTAVLLAETVPAPLALPAAPDAAIQDDSGRPCIPIAPGSVFRIVPLVLEALKNAGVHLYMGRGTVVVADQDRAPCPLTPTHLKLLLFKHMRFVKVGAKAMCDVNPPADLVQALLQDPQRMLPEIRGVFDMPVLLPDGRVITVPGYDAGSGIYYAPAAMFASLQLPDQPARADAVAALRVLAQPFVDFLFVDEESRSAAIAALVTAVVREALRGPVPVVAISAPQPGTGKSLIAKIIGLVATGASVSVVCQARNEEMVKLLASWGKAGTRVVIVDNAARPIGGSAFESATSADAWEARQLHGNAMISGPVRTFFLVTGNNIRVTPDMARRVMMVRLCADQDRPADRSDWTHADLEGWVRVHRAELVSAAIVLCRAYMLASNPVQDLIALGSFNAWSALVPSAIVWAGGVDPCSTRADAHVDPAVKAWRIVLGVAGAHFGNNTFSSTDLARLGVGTRLTAPGAADNFREALSILTGTTSARVPVPKLAKVLDERVDAVHGGLRLVRDNSSLLPCWRVVNVAPVRLVQAAPI